MEGGGGGEAVEGGPGEGRRGGENVWLSGLGNGLCGSCLLVWCSGRGGVAHVVPARCQCTKEPCMVRSKDISEERK
jgi:hypothetical protein